MGCISKKSFNRIRMVAVRCERIKHHYNLVFVRHLRNMAELLNTKILVFYRPSIWCIARHGFELIWDNAHTVFFVVRIWLICQNSKMGNIVPTTHIPCNVGLIGSFGKNVIFLRCRLWMLSFYTRYDYYLSQMY